MQCQWKGDGTMQSQKSQPAASVLTSWKLWPQRSRDMQILNNECWAIFFFMQDISAVSLWPRKANNLYSGVESDHKPMETTLKKLICGASSQGAAVHDYKISVSVLNTKMGTKMYTRQLARQSWEDVSENPMILWVLQQLTVHNRGGSRNFGWGGIDIICNSYHLPATPFLQISPSAG